LCESLRNNTTLQELNLYNNEIKPDGCKMIAAMLSNKCNLKVLGLSQNAIGHGGARELANVAQAALFGL